MKKSSTLQSMLILGLFFFAIFGNAQMASAETVAGPDSDRNLFLSAELWSKYRYNKTEASSNLAMVHDFDLSGEIKIINSTVPAGFRTTKAGIQEGVVSDLNITGGIKYSDDVFSNFVTEPIDYEASSETLLARKLSLIPETEYSFLADEQPLQYFNHESKELDDVQDDLASEIKRTWTGADSAYVNVTAAYLRFGIKYDDMKALIDSIKADPKWDPVDGMTAAQITNVVNDKVAEYTYGLMLSFGNVTALQAEAGKSNYDLANEFVDTLDNSTDKNLSQFTSNSAMITNGIIGYIMEYGITDDTAAMVANGLYGPIASPARGPIQKIELGYTLNQDTNTEETTIFMWYDVFDAVVDVAENFAEGMGILLSNIVPFVAPVEPTEAVPIALTVLLSLAIMFVAILWMGDMSFSKYAMRYKGKGKDAGAVAAKTFIITALAFLVPLVLILNTYYQWY